jgi:hypothetical protein
MGQSWIQPAALKENRSISKGRIDDVSAAKVAPKLEFLLTF